MQDSKTKLDGQRNLHFYICEYVKLHLWPSYKYERPVIDTTIPKCPFKATKSPILI